MGRPESIQWKYRKWLGDDAVLGMDWDATGMHHHLLMISIQQDPPGSIPNDTALMRRWLRSPSDDVWRRVQPQIFSAWTLRGDRWFNAGMVETFELKARFGDRPQNRGTTEVPPESHKDSTNRKTVTVIEPSLDVDVGLEKEEVVELLDAQQAATFICINLGLAGIQEKMKVIDSVKSYIHREKCTAQVAGETLVSLWNKYDSMNLKFKKGIGKFFAEAEWRNAEKWEHDDGLSEKHSKAAATVASNREILLADANRNRADSATGRGGDILPPADTPRRLSGMAKGVSGGAS